MAEIQVKNFPLKLIFAIHLILMTWGSQGYWSTSSYLFVNMIFLVILLWAMHAADNPEPLQLAVFVNAIGIVLDVILLSVKYPSRDGVSEHFSVWMAILNLVVRPFTTIVLYRLMQERNGTVGTGNLFFGGSTRSYEDIDRPVVHPIPHTDLSHGSYDFTTPEIGSAQEKSVPPPYNG